ncbi:hypothetical protein NE237_000026 [Protea cynaroides]|uniref:Uncharacterized protein n=1 Tax=Protea cynaroides TaxID=273540 RepID=A0A9Q0GNI0_9MAGN|nr:hypothetical protein NE237_000026 [Protea cynaroides]
MPLTLTSIIPVKRKLSDSFRYPEEYRLGRSKPFRLWKASQLKKSSPQSSHKEEVVFTGTRPSSPRVKPLPFHPSPTERAFIELVASHRWE